jgi:methionine synthase II (cobalamin-independent)
VPVAAVAEAAARPEFVQQGLVTFERRQVEHAPVPAAHGHRRVDALGREAVVAKPRCGLRPHGAETTCP